MLSSLPTSWKVHISDNGGKIRDSGKFDNKRYDMRSSDSIIGLFPNWIRAAEMGTRPWFFLPSDDDIYYPNAEAAVNDALRNLPVETGMVVFGHHVIDEHGIPISSWTPPAVGDAAGKNAFEIFANGVPARMPSVLIRRSAYLESGGISGDFDLTAGDSEVIQRLAIRYPVRFVGTIISGYRVWPGGLTHKKISSKQWQDEIEIWMGKLEENLAKASWKPSKMAIRMLQDEIRLQNLLAGMAHLESIGQKMQLLRLKPYPLLANPRSHLRVLYQLVKAWIR